MEIMIRFLRLCLQCEQLQTRFRSSDLCDIDILVSFISLELGSYVQLKMSRIVATKKSNTTNTLTVFCCIHCFLLPLILVIKQHNISWCVTVVIANTLATYFLSIFYNDPNIFNHYL